jgi:hypothetical protein
MRITLDLAIGLAVWLTLTGAGGAQISCQRYGNQTICSNGQRLQQNGNQTYDNYGNSWQHYQYRTYGSDGSIYSRSGDQTYDNRGNYWVHQGDVTRGSNGTVCRQFGSSLHCN